MFFLHFSIDLGQRGAAGSLYHNELCSAGLCVELMLHSHFLRFTRGCDAAFFDFPKLDSEPGKGC